MRDRLKEIFTTINYVPFPECNIKANLATQFTEHALNQIVDALMVNGVIVPPCKVGQTVLFYTCVCDQEGEEKFDILEGEVISFSLQKEGLCAYCRYKCGLTCWHLVEQDFGKIVFLTREEAEKALKGTRR